MDNRKIEWETCRQCGAENWPGRLVCCECGQNPAATLVIGGRLSLGSVMLLVALVAVCLSAFRVDVFIGLLLVLVVVPTLVSTVLTTKRRVQAGRPPSLFGKIQIYLVAFGIVLVIELATYFAFFTTCIPLGLATMQGNAYMTRSWVPWVVGFTSAFAVGGFLAWLLRNRLWKKR